MNYHSAFLAFLALCVTLLPHSYAAIFSGQDSPALTKGSGQVVRGYIVPIVEPSADGADLTVLIYHAQMDSPVTLTLQIVINDSKNTYIVPLKVLSDHVADNKNGYRSRRKFSLDYQELNRVLQDYVPNAPQLVIEPGTPLFVYALFNTTNHVWGGPYRSGGFYLPYPKGSEATPSKKANESAIERPDVLDVAYPISQALANIYNQSKKGLKAGGQLRSRLEAEGKYQLSKRDFDSVKSQLFELAANERLAQRALGSDWTLELEERYLKKNQDGTLKTDRSGFPVPDPMIDTYYDNDTYDAAKNDMAVRYRWTGENETGTWNFKPGIGRVSREGIVYRVEYGLDTTDDQARSIAKFADSSDSLNPFKVIRQVVPGSTPSDFLKKSVEVSDIRYKFKLTHSSGLIIEVSLDQVTATALRKGTAHKKSAEFYQLEMDIDHLATKSNNQGATGVVAGQLSEQQLKQALERANTSAFIDGRAVLHSEEDVKESSKLRQSKNADFTRATKIITKLRKYLNGSRWMVGAQKYSLAASLLGAVDQTALSASVKNLLKNNKLVCETHLKRKGGS